MSGTRGTMKTKSGLHKPASRLTLADLFGDGPLPDPKQIEAIAKAEQAKRARTARKEGRPTKDSKEHSARLAAIREAAEACNQNPAWAKAWHPVARVFVVERRICGTCGSHYESPGAEGWMIKYLNKNSGATQTYRPVGPIDYRLPVETFTHESTVAVCQLCLHGLVEWPPRSVTILKLEDHSK